MATTSLTTLHRARCAFAILAFCALALCACGGSGGSGATPVELIVTTLANDGPGSLRQVANDAPSGAYVTFDPAIQGGTILLLSHIAFDKTIRIDGGPVGNEMALDGGNNTFHLRVESDGHLDVRGIHFINGQDGGYGGSFWVVNASAELTDVRFTNCTGRQGGAIYMSLGDAVIRRVSAVGCEAEEGGAVYLEGGNVTIAQSSFHFNTAIGGNGGAIGIVGGSHVIRNSTIHGNVVFDPGAFTDDGGGIHIDDDGFFGDALVDIIGCTVTSNSCDGEGGGIYADAGAASNVSMRQTIVAENNGPFAPDMRVDGGIMVDGSYNLIGDGAHSTFFNGLSNNIVGDAFTPEDPMLNLPQVGANNTLYRTSQVGSPVRGAVPQDQCIDEQGAPLSADQLDNNRLVNAAGDIGAMDS